MALIRQANARTMARDAVVLDLGDLKRQADEIRSRALAEAELIVARARTQREEILQGAAEEGRQEGMARGLEEGRQQGREEGRLAAIAEFREQLGRLDGTWAASLGTFTADRERMLADMRHDVLRLAVQMGEMVTKRVLDAHPEAVVDQLGAVLAMLVRPTRLTVTVHPDDQPLLHDALPSLAERFNAAMHVELVPDATLERGSCVARTGGGGSSGGGGGGEIDASIFTQLERIVEALLPGASKAPESPDETPLGDDQP